ncbi:hypothetical protein LU604_00070 [Erwinia tracheiphila]|uniref:Uncharacterized protein n=1 Tax=Erwinia tracheiphila TaxID=65700 RepID=A0A345CW79_9GAMM|nr:hypothetical protein [Erwinia tracheiphila]AXF77696.1 hypothetical protein AV903_19285 [Erwinia tracheiphila]UIA83618.1 hypothetical protein LU604_00070 [Erwinia tracheiphila]UIA92203.1 hypothetical protein LU632_00070 [Erwinia tracheiphila]
MTNEVIVVTAAYGRDQIEKLGGQQELLPIIAAAGADGVAIRRELLRKEKRTACQRPATWFLLAGLQAFYSMPEALFTLQGEPNPHLNRHLVEAQQLSARGLKYSLGGFRHDRDYSLLRKELAALPLTILVENDQTHFGKLAPMARYFHDNAGPQADTRMTFNTGNWL